MKYAPMKHAVAAACLVSALALPAKAQEVVLKVEHFLPAVAPVHARVIEPWCEKLKIESNGRIACQIFPSMQLGGTPAQLVDQVRNGVVDVAWTAPGYSAGRFPVIEAMELPFRVADATSGSVATWKFYEQHDATDFADYKVLALHIGGGMGFFTAKTQVNTLDDLKGLKLRVAGRVAAKTMAALGVQPVAMPPVQMTEAIAKGVVDGALGALDLVNSARINEVTKFYAGPADGLPYPATAILALLMNKQKYDSLPDDLKAVIDANSGLPLVETFGKVWDEETASAVKTLDGGEHAMTFWTAEQLEPLKTATAKVEEEWIADMTAKGFDGAALAAASKELGAAR